MIAALLFSSVLSAQTPATFRLVLPHGKGAITIDTSGDWKLERIYISDNGKRPTVFLANSSTGVNASYMLEFDPPYYNTSEDCRNDSLGGVLRGALSKASLADKHNDSRLLKNGQNLAIGSFLVKKSEGIELNQQNVWGFYAKDNTCATIHLSKAPFHPGDSALFDPLINGFAYQPDYTATASDYAAMASLLPPDMALAYKTVASGGRPTPPQNPSKLDLGQSLTFALPNHPGYLHLDAPNYVITELSAKPNGNEFGIRAQDTSVSKSEILGFLFLTQPSQPTAASCRDWMIRLEKSHGDGYEKKLTFDNLSLHEMRSESGVELATVDYKQSKDPSPHQFVSRAFVASGDLCADIKITAANEIFIRAAQDILKNLKFEPAGLPDFSAKFRYASVLYSHKAYGAAAPLFIEALSLVEQSDDPQHWRRITTDQASMSYGMAGDLQKSRAINEAAIAKDPDYPLYYYNLACADAESGDATAARTHLQQAFDRRANTIKGESLPDPTKDDSILKLMSDESFWSFVERLPKN
jgi:hypothetical protein